ncbi:MAG TPA: NAD(P)-dependent oxidoreductase [Thermodesulfobacteriota bacterium]
MRVAFVGLGAMGAPMVRRLLAAGHEVAVFDVRPEAVAEAVEAGAEGADTPAAAAEGAAAAIVMVIDAGQVSAVLEGPRGLLAGLAPESVVVVMSTVGPEAARRFAEACRSRGIAYVDAPVSGGPGAADAGSLAAIIGGEASGVERVRPLLAVLCRKLYQVGPRPGDGQAVKLVNQLLVGVGAAAVGEAFALADRMGLDQGVLLEVLTHGSGDSWVLRTFGAAAAAGKPDRQDVLPILSKDLGLVLERGLDLGLPLPLASAALARFLDLADAGAGASTLDAVARVLGHTAGEG